MSPCGKRRPGPYAFIVGPHACDRYRARFDPYVTDAQVTLRILTPDVKRAMIRGDARVLVNPDVVVCLDGRKVTTVFRGTQRDVDKGNSTHPRVVSAMMARLEHTLR